MQPISPTLEQLKTSIVTGDDPTAETLARKALDEGLLPLDILVKAIFPGIEECGRLWNDGDYFMSDVILSTEAFKASSKVIEPHIKKSDVSTNGKVAIGVVSGDMHDLGVNIVIAMLQGAGFTVEFLGLDVDNADFIERVKKGDIDILGIGAYMSITMLTIKEIIEELKQQNLRDKVKVLVGGVTLTQQYADEIGADAWGKDAIDAVIKAKELLKVK